MQLTVMVPGEQASTIQVSDEVFARDYNESLIHQVVTAYRAAGRAGTHAQKNRSAVSGGGAKPWNQKGGGRARAGTSRGPLWRHGGVTFAAQPQDYSQKVNKKMYRGAMRSILSELLRQDRLLITQSLQLETHKTRDLLARLQAMQLEHVLIITDAVDENLFLAARNLPNVAVIDVAAVDPVSLLFFSRILITTDALRQFEEMLG